MSETERPPGPWYTGSIEHNPEIARRLGQFLAEFATLEAAMIWLLAITLGGREKDHIAWAIFGHIQNISTRLDILAAAAEAAQLDEGVRGGILSFVEDMRRMSTVRNEYVHGVYETNFITKEVQLTTFGLSKSRRQAKKPVTVHELDMNIAIMRSIAREIMEAYFADELQSAPDPSPQTPP